MGSRNVRTHLMHHVRVLIIGLKMLNFIFTIPKC